VLLLDEATSHLDSDSEADFRETLTKVSRRCAVITIAHRISTVIDADKIVVLSDGRVRACGEHHDLMTRDTLYRRLANSQLQAGAAGREKKAVTDGEAGPEAGSAEQTETVAVGEAL